MRNEITYPFPNLRGTLWITTCTNYDILVLLIAAPGDLRKQNWRVFVTTYPRTHIFTVEQPESSCYITPKSVYRSAFGSYVFALATLEQLYGPAGRYTTVALKGHHYISFSLHYINFDLCEKNIKWLCIHNYLAWIHNYLACIHN